MAGQAQTRREQWVLEVWARINLTNKRTEAERPALEEIINKIRTEAPSLGRSRGWKWACEWFEAEDAAAVKAAFQGTPITVNYLHWLATQSMIWFSREV